MRLLVIGADVILLHPGEHRAADRVRAVRLDAAVPDRDDPVRLAGEEARDGAAVLLLHGELDFVSIAVGLRRAGDGERRDRLPADAGQAALDVRLLECKLLLVVHMPQRTAAAAGKIRAIRLHAVRGRSQNGKKLGKHG